MESQIQLVSDSQSALDWLRRGHARGFIPGLVMLDLNLPGKDGHQLLSEIRSDTDLRAIPVVVMSTSDDFLDIQSAYARGANAYITKPTELESWLQVISTINDFWLSIAKLPR
jgi:CheY-like chemotaxis protein